MDARLREIALDEPDIPPAILLFVVAVPVGDFRADFSGALRKRIVVGRPEYIADRPIGKGFEIDFHGVVLLFGVVPCGGEPFRRKSRFQNFSAVRRHFKGHNIPPKQQLSHRVEQLIGRDPAVDNGSADGYFPQCQHTRQARAAHGAPIGPVQTGDAAGFQIRNHLIHSLLNRGEVPGVLRLMAVIHHLKNMPSLRKLRDCVGKGPYRLCRAGEKQQRPLMFLPVF